MVSVLIRWVGRALVVMSGLLFLGWAGSQVAGRCLFVQLFPDPCLEPMMLSGAEASHQIIDGGGHWLNEGKLTELIVCSRKTAHGWERPQQLIIRNCRIRGSIRIMGMGRNGEAAEVKESSRSLGHTERAQAAAPTDIVISNVEIEAHHRIPLYLAPGVTRVVVEDSKFTGWSVSTGIYLDAESAHNVIRHNHFLLRAARELIAVDGSAHNRIESNRFERVSFGGIYLYRNCGEGGTVRHQAPQQNVIAGNYFNTSTLARGAYGIWLGSRNGRRHYCHQDDGFPFGSSQDNRDFADNNTIKANIFSSSCRRAIRDDGQNNRIVLGFTYENAPSVFF